MKTERPNLDHVIVFAHVVRAGSFTAAGRTLGLPKSTVSRRVSQLEERLGVQLLQRTTRRLRLTEAGAAYHRHCARILEELEAAEQAVSALHAQPRGTLRATAPVDFGAAFLDGVVAEYLRRHDGVSVDLLLTDRVVDLVAEGFDLAIRAGPLADSALVARRLATAGRWICASPAYLAVRGEPRSPEELVDHDAVIFQVGREGATWRLRRGSTVREVTVRGRIAVNNLDVVRKAALAGLGVAVLPGFVCADDLRSGRLRRLLPAWSFPEVTFYAVHPGGRHPPPKLRAFLDLLVERMTPPPWALPTEG